MRDKLLLGAVRGAYSDVMASDRHPVLALMIELNPRDVDVNVHPAKTEVRFRDPAFVRGFVVAALKEAITRSGFRSATTGGMRTLESLRPHGAYPSYHPLHGVASHHRGPSIRPEALDWTTSRANRSSSTRPTASRSMSASRTWSGS